MRNEDCIPIRASLTKHQEGAYGFAVGEHRQVVRDVAAMSAKENAAAPVRAKLYEHQIAAYHFVLCIFCLFDEGDDHGA